MNQPTASPTRDGDGQPAVGSTFVGREREMAQLEDALEEALAGRGRLVLLAGEPGIGKTRLADEASTRSAERGARTLWGRCWESGGAPAYWPWIQVMGAYTRTQDRDLLREQLGHAASDLAQIVPELMRALPDLPPPRAAESEAARQGLFYTTTAFLLEAAATRPIVIVFDDLHASDTPSLLLLRYFAAALAESPILFIATYRDFEVGTDQPFASTVSELMRERVTRRLVLGGLSRPDVARFIELVAGTRPTEAMVEAMYRKTEGNPLYVAELAQLLDQEGQLAKAEDMASLGTAMPEGLRDAIASRLSRVSPECGRVLTLASVIGRDFSIRPLGEAAELSGAQLLPMLEEAITARLIAEVPEARGRMRFSHGLIRDALYEGLPRVRRLELHKQIGEISESRHATDPEPHLAELAHHFVLAVPVVDVSKAVDYARRAGDRAVRSLAFEEAVRLYETALEVSQLGPALEERTRCELLIGLGEALARAGDPRAKEVFLGAAEIAERSRLPQHLARSALGYGGRFVWARAGGDRNVRRLLEAAMEALDPADSELRARVMARLAGVLRDDHAREPRWSLSREAIDMARRLGDPSTLAYALESRHAAIWEPGTLQERLDIAQEMVRLSDESGDKERALQAHGFRFHALFEQGDLVGARAEHRKDEALVQELGQRAQQWLVAVEAAALALFQGRFGEAEALIDRAAALGRDAQSTDAEVSFRLQTYLLRREQGRAGEMEPLIRASAEEFPWYPMFRCVLADLYTRIGRQDSARQIFERLARDDFAALPVDSQWLFSVSLLAEVASTLADQERAAVLYELLTPYAGQNAYSPPEVAIGSVSRGLGLAAATRSRWGEAVQHLEDALEMNRRMGALPWVAHTQRDLAQVLLDRDAPGDAERAAQLLDQAAATGRELGMLAVTDSAASLLEPIGAEERGAATERPRELNVFRREGEYWSIAFEGKAFRLKDTKGLRYLAELLRAAGREIPALDLLAAGEGGRRPSASSVPWEDGLGGAEGGSEELLDPAARSAYRRRVEELQEEIEEAESMSDTERLARAREEMDFVTRELSAATGLGGRPRKGSSPAERARQSVTKAVKVAIERIGRHNLALGRHLSNTVRTGTFCMYAPDPHSPISWRI